VDTLHLKKRIPVPAFVGTLLLIIGGFSIVPLQSRAAANALDEYAVKAALIFNFAKYTDWPPKAFSHPDAPIIIGVLGDDPFGQALDHVVQGRSIKGRRVIVQRASGVAQLEGAHLVFISGSQPQAPQDCAALERAGAVTIGDTAYTRSYTAIGFALEGDRIVFTIDLERTRRTGSQISSQVLKLAKSVKRPADMHSRRV
jgi:hypothetical protein